MEAIKNILSGALIGIANAIPGVSGGTMAVILKIYDRLLGAITLNLKKLKENLFFLITVGVGALIGIFAASFLLSWLFETYVVGTQFFFMGVIIGSLPAIYKETKAADPNGKIAPINIIPFLLGLGIIVGISIYDIVTGNAKDMSNYQTVLTVPLFFILLFGAVLGAVSMVIPGISGSLVMLIIGIYPTIINAVKDLNIPLLIPIGIGVVIGILGAAKLISVLLSRWRQATYCAILGLVLGSVVAIYPQEFVFANDWLVALITLVIGAALPTLTELPGKLKKEEVND